MKKFLLFGLALLLLGSALFADDAKVMPMMVGRLYVAPLFSFVPGAYDEDGAYKSNDDGSVQLFNLGFALEYGVIDWITAAVQWVPGWTPWSDLKAATKANFPEAKTNMNGVADLFVGAKIQIVGEKAPVENEMFRVALAPGVIIPLPGPNLEDEVKKAMEGKEATLNIMDNHSFGAGARVYFDWIINENFFLNLFNETIFFPLKEDINEHSPAFYAAKGMMARNTTLQTVLGGYGVNPLEIMDIEGEVGYKFRLTFELEPVFTTPIAQGISFTAGLPINYRYNPANDYSFSFPAALDPFKSMLEPNLAGAFSSDPSHVLSLGPNVSLFITKTPLPLEFKFQYKVPVYGINASAQHAAIFQIRAYFALPGRPQ